MTDNPQLLYPGSPFLPEITDNQLLATKLEIKLLNKPIIVAISYTLTDVAINLHDYFMSDLKWLLDTFNATEEDLDLFITGYSMPLSMVITSHLIGKVGFRETIKKMCPPATDSFLHQVNVYKTRHMVECYEVHQRFSFNPKRDGLETIEYCEKHSFSPNRYYLSGISAFRNNYLDIYQKIVSPFTS
jgi:hypothetical protein